jgi:transposase-like protein
MRPSIVGGLFVSPGIVYAMPSIPEKGIARLEGTQLASFLRVGPSRMVIVIEFHCHVHEYVDQFTQLVFPRPEVCPHCHAVYLFVGHGFYLRKPLSPTQVYRVWIKRWYCKGCHHTLSLLPSFLLRFRHYLLDVIQAVVVTRFEDGASWTQVSRRCAVEGLPSSRTIRRWCVSFAAHAPAWWSAVQETLAHHDAGSPLLDPIGANAGPRDAPRALLQAALHLLAWAKTQWTEVIAYGFFDRLRFLWHWGAGQGLGRLI